MATAISLKSESSDTYLYLFENDSTIPEMLEEISEDLGEELEYVWIEDVAGREYEPSDIIKAFNALTSS